MKERIHQWTFFLCILLSLHSCIGNSPRDQRTRNLFANNQEADNEPNPQEQEFSLNWFISNSAFNGSAIIDRDFNSVVYLQGSALDSYLKIEDRSSKNYCLVIEFANTPGAKTLRSKAIPFYRRNLETNTFSWDLRVELGDEEGNKTFCGPATNLATTAYVPSATCTNCTLSYTSTALKLFLSSQTSLVPSTLDLGAINLQELKLIINPENNSTDNSGTCNDQLCQSRGSDCCLNSQCVINASERPNVSSRSDYQEAITLVSQIPSLYKTYPQIFYVCTNTPTDNDDEDEDPNGNNNNGQQAAIDRLNLLKNYYACLTDNLNCATASFPPTQAEVLAIVQSLCGCTDDFCPGLGLKEVKNAQDEVTNIECRYTNPPSDDNFPKRVSLNTRSAPHRLYLSDGSVDDNWEVNLSSTNSSSSLLQETDSIYLKEFSYDDPTNKVDPQNVEANMYAILGNFKTDLSEALPAKVIPVKVGVEYVLTLVGGQTNTCPMCAPDSYEPVFSAYPNNLSGLGLQSLGYSAEVDDIIENFSRGNRDDTLFGRACYIPPTMIPFTHVSGGPTQTTRQQRLTNQAILYMNGYQKDWFGFNLGAAIGSFDGVNWFAIGNSRRLQAKSNKLFLAINAPFRDLALSSEIVIDIDKASSNGDQAEWDYNPNLDLYHPSQNLGASCQRWHQCEYDVDCVTQLGWEYMCADVSKLSTNWPRFDNEASESADYSARKITQNLLNGLTFNQASNYGNKRCIYRGRGAVCKFDYSADTPNNQKYFQCAKNFRCSQFTEMSLTLEREPNNLNSILFGRSAKILGRPTPYFGSTDLSASSFKTDLENNLLTNTASGSDFGVCVPDLDGDDSLAATLSTHQNNAGFESDYINQVGVCSSSTNTCPAFSYDSTKNTFTDLSNSPTGSSFSKQNMCSSILGTDLDGLGGTDINLLASNLSSLTSLTERSFAPNSCLRLAGAPCFSSLECSPNELIAREAQDLDDTSALNLVNKAFWTEALTCSTGELSPASGYDKNLSLRSKSCCREIDSTYSLYTAINPAAIALIPDSPGDFSASDYLKTENQTTKLQMNLAPITELDLSTLNDQWKTVAEVGQNTCCGKGWVRGFTTGDHDWKNRSRFSFPIENFQCLNYANKIVRDSSLGENREIYQGMLCYSPNDNACLQTKISGSTNFKITYPSVKTDFTGSFRTVPLRINGDDFYALQYHPDATPFAFIPTPDSVANDNGTQSIYLTQGTGGLLRLYIPPYVDPTQIDVSQLTTCSNTNGVSGCTSGAITSPVLLCGGAPAIGATCRDGNILVSNFAAVGANEIAGLQISYDIVGLDGDSLSPGNSLYYLTKLARLELLGVPQIFHEAISCNDDRQELLNYTTDTTLTDFNTNAISFVPAITSPAQIYDSTVANATANDNSVGSLEKIVFQNRINLSPIFSEDQFYCCRELGKKTESANKCCTQFAAANTDGDLICQLPAGADLSVYFNRYISSDGRGSSQPGGGLNDTDFIPETGEPKLTTAVFNKLIALGQTYCQNKKVRFGGVMGNFLGEPNNGTFFNENQNGSNRIFSFADSPMDFDPTTQNGSSAYENGFRWNHHIYCDD